MREINKGEVVGYLLSGGLAAIGLGAISLFCSPMIVRRHLRPLHQQTFDQLLNNSNERKEVEKLLAAIPDGSEQVAAGFIDGAMEVFKPGKRRRLDKKISGKPHHAALTGLRAAASIIPRKNNL